MISGASRPALPRWGLGCAPIGDLYETVDPTVAINAVHTALALGSNLLDTAPKYGNGLSERRLGQALASVDRREYWLSTKVGWGIAGDRAPIPAFSEGGVMRSLEGSMRRLGVDRFDIVHVHDPDDHIDQAIAETVPTLLRLRDEGVVGAVGAGMNSDRFLAELVRRTDLDCVLIAGRYTLLEQGALSDLLPLCAERGVEVIAAGIFNSGLLADPRPGAPYNYRPVPDEVLQRALRLKEICGRHNVPLRAAALQFPLSHPAVNTVLVGAAGPMEVADNVAMAKVPLPAVLWSDLREAGLIDPRVPLP
ncbi:aldo/keto reductase [Streptomyces sp. MBT84]|uniref:aldo/keto reductase n=1 Tax=Streptomyces sp. MBT84 TaxID=1488414 RepID=UPI001C6EC14C|nr:aldo/keto reductase [Streptomyces sp. MBT84]